MRYISTRGKAPTLNFEAIVTSGLASDGGLYVPETIPELAEEKIQSWKGLSYQELAVEVMLPFVDECLDRDALTKLVNKSYSTFRAPDVAPLKKLSDNTYVLELFHGPTLAFKDFALQFLGNVLDYVLDKRQENVVIVGATSGDTGSAAIAGCQHCKHVQLFMLHPFGRVSNVQRHQMTTILSNNIHNISIDSHFDDCQDMVKSMFRNGDFIDYPLVAVNSINWTRIMAQIVYYFYAALQLGAPEKPVSFSVPTGNFGDIFAGYIAHRMGLPINKLIVATNSNDILHRFFSNNDYRKTGVDPTLSPSMDIQISSNFERLLFELYNRDGASIERLMDDFSTSGKLTASDEVMTKAQQLFDSAKADDNTIRSVIRSTYDDNNYITDPHTATGIHAARECHKDNTPVIVLSTAHPAKFPDVAQEVLNITPPLPEHLNDLLDRDEHYDQLPNNLEKVKSYITEKLQ